MHFSGPWGEMFEGDCIPQPEETPVEIDVDATEGDTASSEPTSKGEVENYFYENPQYNLRSITLARCVSVALSLCTVDQDTRCRYLGNGMGADDLFSRVKPEPWHLPTVGAQWGLSPSLPLSLSLSLSLSL